MTDADISGRTVVVVSAGYQGKRRALERMAALGARLVVVDEPGHWSQSLVAEGVATEWVPAEVSGSPDDDAAAVLAALGTAGVRPDGVLTFWEDSVSVAARVATALGLPTNSPEAVDTARSKLRTRRRCEELGMPSPRSRRVRSVDELFAASQFVGFPAVVKPEFGASAVGCVRVDDLASLPKVYELVRDVVNADHDTIFRAGNDLLVEEYLDGVEFDVDLVMHDGRCLFVSVSQNWPTAEPSFQERGLHCPPDHNRREVRKLVDLCIRVVQGFGLHRGVLHVEGKATSKGPRIVEVNARMGGGRIYEVVRAVWGVDLVEAQLRSALGLPPNVRPARSPRAAAVNAMVHAPATGRLASLSFPGAVPGCAELYVDVAADVGDPVDGPDRVFSTVLAEVMAVGEDLRRARSHMAAVLATPPVVTPTSSDIG